MTKNAPISNSYLRLLSQDLNLLEVLSNIDVEVIEDRHTKVICRTIQGSVEALFEYLNSDTEDLEAAWKLRPLGADA